MEVNKIRLLSRKASYELISENRVYLDINKKRYVITPSGELKELKEVIEE